MNIMIDNHLHPIYLILSDVSYITLDNQSTVDVFKQKGWGKL